MLLDKRDSYIKVLRNLIRVSEGDLEFNFFEPLDSILRTYKKKDKKIILYGAGSAGYKVLRYLKMKGIEIDHFCDTDPKKQGCMIEGKKVLSPNKLNEDSFVVITSSKEKEIALLLKARNIRYVSGFIEVFYDLWGNYRVHLSNHIDKLMTIYDLLEDEESKIIFSSYLKYLAARDPLALNSSTYNQYCHPRIDFENINAILDGGAFPGEFADFIRERFPRIKFYLFEPDHVNFYFLKNKYKHDDLVEIINEALFEEEDILYFSCKGNVSSHLIKENSMVVDIKDTKKIKKVKTISIDSFVNKKLKDQDKPFLVKMDIEGAELEALRGARSVISRLKPTLAVCLYHKPEHLFEIPLYIHSLNKGFKLFMGFHEEHDLVLYAI